MESKLESVIKIGNQYWMANNLNTLKFQNGDLISVAKSEKEWKFFCKNKTAAIFLSNEFPNEVLYNYYALVDKRCLLPEGFFLPFLSDIHTLLKFLGKYSGVKLKSSNNKEWPEIAYLEKDERERKQNLGNSTRFSSKPTGMVRPDGQYVCGFRANYWSFENENYHPCILQLIEGVETAVIMNEADFKKNNLLYVFYRLREKRFLLFFW